MRAQQRPERGVGAAPAAETPRPPGVVSAPAEEIGTVDRGPREIRDLEGTHRFCHFLLSKLMCNGHLLNVSIPKSGKSDVGFSRSGFL